MLGISTCRLMPAYYNTRNYPPLHFFDGGAAYKMLKNKFYLQHTVDVYVSELENDLVSITFHRMTTRERVEINTTKSVAEFLALLNGKRSVQNILTKLGNFSEEEAISLISFLQQQHLITLSSEEDNEGSRYARQIAYFDDLILNRKGELSQEILSNKKVAILGCGAVSSTIAETLVRSGIENIVLVDYKTFTLSNLFRHTFATISDVGMFKAEALGHFLKNINSTIEVDVIIDRLLPTTDLRDWIPPDIDIVINSCDEPYIGHTSMKLGHYLQNRNIPLYVVGGFDAHLMSSGELVYPPFTPCITCIQKTFHDALLDWKPTYTKAREYNQLVDDFDHFLFNEAQKIGGAGGLPMMSNYSGYIASLKIIHFLVEDPNYDYSSLRYEYLPNKGTLTGFSLLKQDGCDVCNR